MAGEPGGGRGASWVADEPGGGSGMNWAVAAPGEPGRAPSENRVAGAGELASSFA